MATPYIELDNPDRFDLMFAGKRRTVVLSVSSIVVYLMCPFKFYLKYLDPNRSGTKYVTDYERLCGSLVHRFIAKLYKEHNHSGRVYFKSVDSSIKQWNFIWAKEVGDNKDFLEKVDFGEGKYYEKVGETCIRKYWALNETLTNPIEIEKTYTIPLAKGFKLSGRIDQIRSMSLDKISALRPDIVVKGALDDNYDPVVIVDLKTDPFNHDDSKQDKTFEEVMKLQYRLFQRLQVGAYTRLYKEHHSGKLPVCFSIYQLRYNSFTNLFGDIKEYQNFLSESVDKVVKSVTDAKFQKCAGKNCVSCEFKDRCRTFDSKKSLEMPAPKDEYKQKKFSFKYKPPVNQ